MNNYAHWAVIGAFVQVMSAAPAAACCVFEVPAAACCVSVCCVFCVLCCVVCLMPAAACCVFVCCVLCCVVCCVFDAGGGL